MNRFDLFKTIQLIIYIGLTISALLVVFINKDLYARIASDSNVALLAIFLWVALGLSLVFLYFDFRSYTDIKREHSELDNAIYSDALTGIANRYSVDVYLGQFLNKPLPEDIGCVTLELTNLSDINAAKGHAGGDAVIQEFTDILQHAANGACFIGRNGGNKFLAIIRDCTDRKIKNFTGSVAEQIKSRNDKEDIPVRYCFGQAFNEGDGVKTLTELVALSDRRAWQNSQADADLKI